MQEKTRMDTDRQTDEQDEMPEQSSPKQRDVRTPAQSLGEARFFKHPELDRGKGPSTR